MSLKVNHHTKRKMKLKIGPFDLRQACFWILIIFISPVAVLSASEPKIPENQMVLISGGHYSPLYKENGVERSIKVDPFYLDKYQVSNQLFSKFIEANPKWKKFRISSLFADERYLSQLDSGLQEAQSNQPVTNVSWYAAMAYCKAHNKSLPTLDQWEVVAQASATSPYGLSEPDFKRKILDWYARPATINLPNIQNTQSNYWQVHGMHGVVWEHVSDFNSNMTTGESRANSALDQQLFCGSGAALAVDPGDYAAFMRYAIRSSYEANYTLESMGFRCAKTL